MVTALEEVSEKWQSTIESLQDSHRRAIAEMNVKFQQQLQAYKSAANQASLDVEGGDGALEMERSNHLKTLTELSEGKERIKRAERENGERVGELLEGLNERGELVEEMEGRLEKQEHEHCLKVNELVKRLDELEEIQKYKSMEADANMVSREAVAEMEGLFESTIERLMDRVNSLEANAKENREFKEIKEVGRKIQDSRNSNMDGESLRLLEQMESNAKQTFLGANGSGGGGGGARIAPGRIRPRQAF